MIPADQRLSLKKRVDRVREAIATPHSFKCRYLSDTPACTCGRDTALVSVLLDIQDPRCVFPESDRERLDRIYRDHIVDRDHEQEKKDRRAVLMKCLIGATLDGMPYEAKRYAEELKMMDRWTVQTKRASFNIGTFLYSAGSRR